MKCKIRAISSLAVTASLLSTLSPSSAYAMMNEPGKSNVIESHSGSNTGEITNSDNNDSSNASNNTSSNSLSSTEESSSENINSNDEISNEENPTDLLIEAITEGNLVAIKKLIYEHEGLVNSVNNFGYSMLQNAVLFNQPEVVKLLINSGADLDFLDPDNQTALQISKVNKFTNIENMIASAMFFQAIEKHDLNQIQNLVAEYNFLINCADEEKNSALHESIKSGDPAVVSFLISKGANVWAKNEDGQTPLHLMAKLDNLNVSVMEQMINAAKKSFLYVNDVDNDHRTALHLSSLNNNINNVKLLVDCGSDINASDKYGKTPLYYSMESFENKRNTDLHLAVMKNDANLVNLLISNGANLDAQNARGETPLHIAAFYNYSNLVWLLLSSGKQKGANPNIRDNEWKTPIHISAIRNNFEITDLLIAYGADRNAVDIYGARPLDYAFYSSMGKTPMLPKNLISPTFSNSNFTGLSNIGNSCYYNAAIQQLYNIRSLRTALINIYLANEQNHTHNNSFLDRLSHLFYEMENSKGGRINSKLMNDTIGMLVDKNRGDSIDIAFQTIFELLKECGFNCQNDFRIIDNRNIFSVFSGNQSRFLPNPNSIDVSQILNFMFSNQFETSNPNSIRANNVLVNLNYFNQKMTCFNIPQVYRNTRGEDFELESLSVNLGNHFVAWVKDQNGNWVRISDSFVSGEVSFNEMLTRAQREGNIASLMYTKR